MHLPGDQSSNPELFQTAILTQSGKSPAETAVEATLVFIHPKNSDLGRRYHVGLEPVSLGRASECGIVASDSSVSRVHARIEIGSDGRHCLTDLGSTNGTFVNNVRTTGGPINDGDYLRFGNCIYRYLAGGNVEAEYHEEIYRLTVMDPLTGIHNRRYLMEILSREVARSVRHRRPLALALFDVDHFKSINDKLGHVAGDMTLRQIASCIGKLIRTDEVFARYGGEEFVVLLTETGKEQSAVFGERVRAAIESFPFTFEGTAYSVTVSVGIGTTDGLEALTPEQLTQRADDLMYQAKRAGRNRVMV